MATKTTRKPSKPSPLRTPNLSAYCHIDRNRVVVEISDRAPWQDMGSNIPTIEELEKLGRWLNRVRSFRKNRNRRASA